MKGRNVEHDRGQRQKPPSPSMNRVLRDRRPGCTDFAAMAEKSNAAQHAPPVTLPEVKWLKRPEVG